MNIMVGNLAKHGAMIFVLVFVGIMFMIFLGWQGTSIVLGLIIWYIAYLFLQAKGVPWMVPLGLVVLGLVTMTGILGTGTMFDTSTDLVDVGKTYDSTTGNYIISATLDGSASSWRATLLTDEVVDGGVVTHDVKLAIRPTTLGWQASTYDLSTMYYDELGMWIPGNEWNCLLSIGGYGATLTPVPAWRIDTGSGVLKQSVTVELQVDGQVVGTRTVPLGATGFRDVKLDQADQDFFGTRLIFHGFLTSGIGVPSGDVSLYRVGGPLRSAYTQDIFESVEDWNEIQRFLSSCWNDPTDPKYWSYSYPPTLRTAFQYLDSWGQAPATYSGLPSPNTVILYGADQHPDPFHEDIFGPIFGYEDPSGVFRTYGSNEWSALLTFHVPASIAGRGTLVDPWIEQPEPQPNIISANIGCTVEGQDGTLVVRVHNSGDTGQITVTADATGYGSLTPVGDNAPTIQSGETVEVQFIARPGATNTDKTGEITVYANGEGGSTDSRVVDWCIKDRSDIGQGALSIRAVAPDGSSTVGDAPIYVDHQAVGYGAVTVTVDAGVQHTIYGLNTTLFYAPGDWTFETVSAGQTKTVLLEYTDAPPGTDWWSWLWDLLVVYWYFWVIPLIAIILYVVIRYVI